jgi:hypothetical protein
VQGYGESQLTSSYLSRKFAWFPGEKLKWLSTPIRGKPETRAEDSNALHATRQEDGGREVSGQSVVAGENAAEVFEATEGILDAVTSTISFLAEFEWLFPVGSVRNDHLGAAAAQPLWVIRRYHKPCRPAAVWPVWFG